MPDRPKMSPADISRAFGRRLAAARLLAGFQTAADFARHIGIQDETYRTYEKGTREPNLWAITMICLALSAPADQLLGLGEPRQSKRRAANR